MKFAILALFGLFAIQAVELPTSDELVERRHRRGEQDDEPVEKKRHGRKQRRVEQDEEPVEKKRHGRKHRRADEDEMIEKKKRHGRKQRRVEQDEELAEIVPINAEQTSDIYSYATVMPTGWSSRFNRIRPAVMPTVVSAPTKKNKKTTK